MKIEVITSYYREEFLAPLFFMHYDWADKITVLTERFPDNKFNDHLKTDLINRAIADSRADWVIVVDFDEFVFPLPFGIDPRYALESEHGHKMNVHMWRVWRHRTDLDIDRMAKPVMQRIHGVANHEHTKPCIFRPGGVTVDVGVHNATFPAHYRWSDWTWEAAHWANADWCFGIDRSRRDRQARICQQQLNENLGVIPEWLEPGYLEAIYQQHLNDPVIGPIEKSLAMNSVPT